MNEQRNRSPVARWSLRLSALAFAAFVANVLYGKWLVSSGHTMGSPVDGVAEFLLLLVAVALFMTFAQIRTDNNRAREDP